jgi:hypothetical protein
MNPEEHENPEIQTPPPESAPPPVAPVGQIQWGLFFRTASPLAILTGVMTYIFFPVGFLLVLPFSLKRIIARYRAFHPGALRPAQGAAMGAFMAVLSFVAFLVFFLATLSVNREPVLAKMRTMAAQAPDPQLQQRMLLLASNEGFIALAVFTLFLFLAVFLLVGTLSGAVITRPKKPPPPRD